MKIKTGDMVAVISGGDKGKKGKVLSVDHEKGTLVVEGANFSFRHIKPSQKNPEGGRLKKESPIRASKVMAICPSSNKPTRIGYRYLDDGSKERFARISGKSMGEIAPPKASYAKN
ncbi:50S ribosomal protein L24 [Mariniblastus sp.]|nr:50S ribosomal protein L24 [Mariniblastus sp.]